MGQFEGWSHADGVRNWFAPGRWRSTEPTFGTPLRWHPRFELMQQGVSWHGAGAHVTPEHHAALSAAERALYPEGREMTELRVWQTTDPDTVMMEWRDRGTLWSGRETANGGLSVLEFEAGRVRRMRTFTNTAYLQSVERGWEHLLRDDILLRLPAFHTVDAPDLSFRPYPPSRRAFVEGQQNLRPPEPGPETSIDRVLARFGGTRAHLYGPNFEGGHEALPQAPGSYWEFQGTRWPLAGRNLIDSPAEFADRLASTLAPIFQSLNFTHFYAWTTTDQEWAFMEWVSRGAFFTGTTFRNHGLTAIRLDARGRSAEHREYQNVAYIEAAHGDWRHLVDQDLFLRLACAETYDLAPEDWVPTPLDPGRTGDE